MLEKHKLPSFGAGLMIVDKAFSFAQLGKIVNFPVIIVFISIFSFVFLTENNKTGVTAKNKITGEMVKVTK